MHDHVDFVEECLREHNRLRKLHMVEPLRHSIALDKTAQEWAETLLQKEDVVNSPLSNRGEIGESISKRTATTDLVDILGVELTAQWYSDIRNYDFESGTGPAGNFTQLVWAGTKEVGFGKARRKGQCVVVAHYRPPGNVRGRYRNNVFPAISEQSNKDFSPPRQTITKKTVSKDKEMDANGQEHVVFREVSETKDAGNSVYRRVVERFVDDNGAQVFEHRENALPPPSIKLTPSQPSNQTPLEFSEEMVRIHNSYRRLHGAADLVLNARLCAMAQEWAEFLVEEACLSNSGFTVDGVRLGENITSRWSNRALEKTASDVVETWYQEASRFKYGSEPVSIQGIGNFTQMIWASSRSLGVGKATRIIQNETANEEGDAPFSSKTVVVCFYFPPGNVASYFGENVHPPLPEQNNSPIGSSSAEK
uniref:SCP domain-containing protein n=2 Tax=Mesocestoides corti TaxID=53468 RepID=A0A5K3F670_MESCO